MGCFLTLDSENKKRYACFHGNRKKNINLEVKHFPINNDK